MPDFKSEPEDAPLDISAEISKAGRKGIFLISVLKWTAWAVIAWQIRLSIEVLAGKSAFSSLLTRVWRQASIWEVVCWTVGMLGLMFGLHSRYLYHRQVSQDSSQWRSIEKRLKVLSGVFENPSSPDSRKES